MKDEFKKFLSDMIFKYTNSNNEVYKNEILKILLLIFNVYISNEDI